MKTPIPTSMKSARRDIKRGLDDPMARALVRLVGALSVLPSDKARMRVLRFVDDKLCEDNLGYRSAFARELGR